MSAARSRRRAVDVAHGHRRIVPQAGGTFTGLEISGKRLPGASADWQIVLPDGTLFGDIRYPQQTDGGDLLYVQPRGVRHGSAQVNLQLDWLERGVFISVGGRRATAVIQETYLVG